MHSHFKIASVVKGPAHSQVFSLILGYVISLKDILACTERKGKGMQKIKNKIKMAEFHLTASVSSSL